MYNFEKGSHANKMTFQVWSKKINTGTFHCKSVSDNLESVKEQLPKIVLELFKKCEVENTPCGGVMLHYSGGCFFWDND